MLFNDAAQIVRGIPLPHTHPSRGRVLYRHIKRTQPKDLLELGTARGGSAVFIAAALEVNGAGHLTSVDRFAGAFADPSPREVLDKAGLGDWVTLDNSFSTYTWFLKSEIEKRLKPSGAVRPGYDFIFLDGAKNWSTDGLAVILAEKLLRPGGWLLLDDLGWSYGKNVKGERHYGTNLARLSEEEKVQPHLRAIFDLLIRTNPAFDRFVIQDDWWGWARKSPNASPQTGGALTRTKKKKAGPNASQRPGGAVRGGTKGKAGAPSGPPRPLWQRVPRGVRRRIRQLRRKATRAS